MPSHRKPVLGTFVGIAAVVVGSPTFVIVRVLRHHNAFQQLLLRSPFFLGTALFIALLRWCRPGGLAKLTSAVQSLGWHGAFACIFLATQSVAIVVSLLLTSMSNVAFIINTTPIFCAISDRILLQEKCKPHTLFMIVLGLIAVVIIVGGDLDSSSDFIWGNIIALGNPISWTVYWAFVRNRSSRQSQSHQKQQVLENGKKKNQENKKTNQDLPTGCATNKKWDDVLLYQIGSGIVVLFAGGIGLGCGAKWKDPAEIPSDWLVYWLYGGVVLPSCVALFSTAPMYISTTEMGIIKMLEMVLIPIYGYFYTGEVPTTASWIGGSLLVLTLTIHAFFSIQEQREQQQRQQQQRRGELGACGMHSCGIDSSSTSSIDISLSLVAAKEHI